LTVTDTQIDYTMLSVNGYWSTSGTSLNSGGLFIANGNLLTFTGVTITGVTLDAASNVPGFTSANVTFNSGNVAVDWAGLTGIPQGSQVILDVTSTGGSSVPEPAAWITMLAGFAAIAVRRFRNSSSTLFFERVPAPVAHFIAFEVFLLDVPCSGWRRLFTWPRNSAGP
jgi:hypothetical protein